MKGYWKILAILVLTHINDASDNLKEIWLHPDTGLNIYQFLSRHNYTYENHTITTEDGYILKTFRIPRGKNDSNSNGTKPAVLLLHGIWSNPQDLILQGDSSIGIMLADAGYDVWLMASRGNTYSVAHTSLNTTSEEFWDFGWHEVGYYDIAANIDYIINETGKEKVSFIGHSQGGTAFAALGAARPEYNSKIAVAHLWAPVMYMDYTQMAATTIFKNNIPLFKEFAKVLGLDKNVGSYSPLTLPITTIFCHRDSPIMGICRDFVGFLNGPDPDNLDPAMFTVMSSNDPSGGSFKQLLHYLQIAKTGTFQYFDYGTIENMIKYGQTTPPIYNLSAISCPTYVWYGQNDYFCGVKDYQQVVSRIPNAVDKQVPYPLWNHIDFIYAYIGSREVFQSNIDILDIFNNAN